MPAAKRKTAILPEPVPGPDYDPDCRRCPRLTAFVAGVRARHPAYFCRPVPPFGSPVARLVVVGLAPGLHGANASGRPFTGDYAGILLYATLHAHGFASQPNGARSDDGLVLIDCRVTNAVKCLPPANKPGSAEVRACNGYLASDLARLPDGGAVLALGRVAHDATLLALGRKPTTARFAHGAVHPLGGRRMLFDSYHCSRYNTNTRRLTAAMFDAVVAAAAAHLRGADQGDG